MIFFELTEDLVDYRLKVFFKNWVDKITIIQDNPDGRLANFVVIFIVLILQSIFIFQVYKRMVRKLSG